MQVYAPTPVNLLGASATLESVEYCYQTLSGMTIDEVHIAKHETSGNPESSFVVIETDDSDRADEACRTLVLGTPETILGTETIYLMLDMDAAGGGDAVTVSRTTFNYSTG